MLPLVENSCVSCSVRSRIPILKLQLDIKLSLVAPGTPPILVACPCCDSFWEENCFTPLRLSESNLGSASMPRMQEHTQFRNIDHRRDYGGVIGSAVSNPYGDNGRSVNEVQRNDIASVSTAVSDYGAAASGQGYRGRNDSHRGGAGGRGRGRVNTDRSSDGGGAGRGGALAFALGPPCVCGGSSIRRIVTKDGPNKGRGFFTCPKPRFVRIYDDNKYVRYYII